MPNMTPSAEPDFTALYDEHVWTVYGFFAYRTGRRADAEDLTQQTFERALRASKRFDPNRGAASTWLMAIARNLLIDFYRSDRSRRQTAVDDADLAALPGESDAYDIGVSPDLADGLAALAAREREVIALRYGGDLTGQEIAELTGLTLANVQQINSRALRKLRERLS